MKITSTVTALLLLLLSLGCNNPKSPNQFSDTFQQASPQQAPKPRAATARQPFDYYLLNLSWSPEFCATHPTAAECAQHRAFTLHGLWPQNNGGTYPENCSNAAGPKNPAQYSDIYPDSGLLRHEWKTHGTCSGLTPDDFFNLARQAVHSVSIPNQLTSLDHQASMPPSQILDLFAEANPTFPRESFALSCGNNYLTAVEACMDKTLKPIVCGPIRTCRANSVRIPPPQHTN